MSKTEALQVELRACYEHFKSRPDKRKTLTALGFSAVKNDVEVLCVNDNDPDRIYRIPIDKFEGTVVRDDNRMPRYTLLEQDVITTEERDLLLDELDEDN